MKLSPVWRTNIVIIELGTLSKFRLGRRGPVCLIVEKKFIPRTEYMNISSTSKPPTLIREGIVRIKASNIMSRLLCFLKILNKRQILKTLRTVAIEDL